MYAITEGLNTWECEVMQHRVHNIFHTQWLISAVVTLHVLQQRSRGTDIVIAGVQRWGNGFSLWLSKDSQAQLLDPYVSVMC